MKHARFSLVLFVTAATACRLSAATYYVAGTGSDSADGLSPTNAWRTIEKVNSQGGVGHSFLFRRGDAFRGELVTVGSNITYGAYGTGARPVIKGSVAITNWTWDATHACYVADQTNALRHLFVDGALMRIARYPNADAADLGWLRTDSGSSKTTFFDAALGAYGRSNGYWNGATLRIRSYSWLFEIRTVTAYTSDGTVTLHTNLTDTGGSTISPGWGYYLDGKLGELDQTNEWYYDAANSKVYLAPPGGADPNTLLVEGTCREHGIYMDWEKEDMLIENLAFEHQVQTGIELVFVDRAIIRDCAFRYCEQMGIRFGYACRNITVENNLFEDMLNHAMEGITSGPGGPGTTIVQSNIVRRTALVAGYGRSGSAESSAFRFYGENTIVRRNIVEDVGHCGIYLGGAGGHICEENIFRRAQLLLDDGGTIDINGSDLVVRRNFVFDTWGNRDISNGESESGWVHGQMGFAIFTQPNCNNNIIEANTLAHNIGGLLTDTTTNTMVRSNVIYNTRSDYIPQHVSFLANHAPSGMGDQLIDNIFCSLSATQLCIGTVTDYDSGFSDRNIYFNPYTADVVREGWEGDPYYTLTEWRARYPARDPNSETNLVSFPADAVTGVATQDVALIMNTNGTPATVNLNGNVYEDLAGNQVAGNVVLGPFRATVLVLRALAGADNDHDELDDAWELTYFFATNAVSGEPTDDADGDGFCNLYEFLGGCDPTNSASRLAIDSMRVVGGSDVILRWDSVSNKVYAIGQTTNVTGPWAPVRGGLTGAPPHNTWTTSVDGASRYYRIELE